MIHSISLDNFGPLKNIHWWPLGNINVIIGANGSGKTFLLKSMYSAIKSIENYKKGNDPRKIEELLAEKLYWTFQNPKIGDLQNKTTNEKLNFKMNFNEGELRYSLTDRANTALSDVVLDSLTKRTTNSIFIPAKEVLSAFAIITKSKNDKLFGFDDTYSDLTQALLHPAKAVEQSSDSYFSSLFEGSVTFDKTKNEWMYQKGKSTFSIQSTAEGIKKLAMLDVLLKNNFLTPGSTIFIDEPESALHPSMIIKFLDVLERLSNSGMQIIMATHSYFVIKKLYLIAKQKKFHIPIVSIDKERVTYADLIDGMPENEIINESIRLYESEIEGVLD